MFDTFNDFFLNYWNSEYTELNADRFEFLKITKIVNNNSFIKFKFDKVDNTLSVSGDFDNRWDDPNYLNETRMRLSFVFSGIFYILILLISMFKKGSITYLLSPYIGIVIISLSALGVFGTNNFTLSWRQF